MGYGAELETLLVVVKNVRNAFAHGMTPMDFSNPTLAEECVKLRSKTTDPADWVLTARQTFAYSCITLSRILGMKGLAQAHIDAMAAKLKGLPQSTLRDLSSGGEIGVESK